MMTRRQGEVAADIRHRLNEARKLGHQTASGRKSAEEALGALLKAKEHQDRATVGSESRVANDYLRIGLAAAKSAFLSAKEAAFREGDSSRRKALKKMGAGARKSAR